METSTRSATSLSEAVAKEIRVLLVRRDMKQTELAAQLGVGEMWLSRRLRGAQPLDLNDLDRIARAMGVQVTDLLPRRSEGDLVVTAGQRRGPDGELMTVKETSPRRPRLIGHTSRSHPDQATRRPARMHAVRN